MDPQTGMPPSNNTNLANAAPPTAASGMPAAPPTVAPPPPAGQTPSTLSKKLPIILSVVVVVILVSAGGAFAWQKTKHTSNPNSGQTDTHSPQSNMGNSTAPVVATTPSSTDNDTLRETDIRAIMTQLEAYYDTHNHYPSLADMNSSSWRAANMPALDPKVLVDPENPAQSSVLLSSPAAHQYAYAPTSKLLDSCETNDTQCAEYQLGATLKNGQQYVKLSLN